MALDDHELTEVGEILAFALGGKSTFTVVSPETTRRFTYQVKATNSPNRFDVSVLTGGDNTGDYQSIGVIYIRGEGESRPALRYRYKARGVRGYRTKVSMDATSVLAFNWVWSNIRRVKSLRGVRFYTSGHCGRCGRKLTVPSSVCAGFGPICAQKMTG